MTIKLYDDERICGNCGYYVQHYTFSGGFQPCNSGYCTYPPVKTKKPGQDACRCFEWKGGPPVQMKAKK